MNKYKLIAAGGIVAAVAALFTISPSAGASTTTQPDCHEAYEPCVPIADDVDCEGGGGDGPEYVAGPVTITGEDEYGLDGDDGDGIGCEGPDTPPVTTGPPTTAPPTTAPPEPEAPPMAAPAPPVVANPTFTG